MILRNDSRHLLFQPYIHVLLLNESGNKTGVVILQIENKSAPLRGLKIINLPQNCALNFQKLPYFEQKLANICQTLRISLKQKLKFYQYLNFIQKKFLKFSIYLPIFVQNMVILENSTRDFGADL